MMSIIATNFAFCVWFTIALCMVHVSRKGETVLLMYRPARNYKYSWLFQTKFCLELLGILLFLCLVPCAVTQCQPLSPQKIVANYAQLYTHYNHIIEGRSRQHAFHESFYSIGSCLAAAVEGLSAGIGQFRRPDYVGGSNDQRCSREDNDRETAAKRSFCPWEYRTDNIDENRYPRILKSARCTCKTCQGSGGFTGVCRGVPYYVRVLRKSGCENGLEKWIPSMEMIYRGCTCTSGPYLWYVFKPWTNHRKCYHLSHARYLLFQYLRE